MLVVTVVLLVLGALYGLRIRRLAQRMQERMEERIVERERIARELHDTLLQGVQGLMLRFQSVANRFPQQEPTRQMMESALERADQVLTEGRNRVQDLRSTQATTDDLVEALREASRELTQEAPQVDLRIVVQGTTRELHPIVRDEAYWIGREAILNAFHHAQAKTVEVEVHYQPREMRIHVRDDGRGMPPEVLEAGSRQGRWGLTGMRERADKIHGRLEIWTRNSAGTEVELRVPGTFAYRQSSLRTSWLLRVVSGQWRNSQS
jgi:signal transduction histidine kinase